MKRESIRKKMFRLICILLGILLLFQITLLLCFNFLFKNVKNTVDKQSLYTSYDSAAVLLQDSVTDYFDNPTSEALAFLNENKKIVCDLSENICDFFQNAQFEDHAIITRAYTDKIQELTDHISQNAGGSPFLLYKECSHLYDLMMRQHSTTLPFEMSLLSDKLSGVFACWNIFNIFILVLLCIVFLIIFVCTSNSIRKIAEPLSLLSTHAKEFERGNYDDSTTDSLLKTGYSEIYILTSAFIHMENTIKEQITALKDKIELSQKVHSLELENMSVQISLAQTENSLMQSLINPHFLFNCLNLLTSFAIIEKAPRVHEYSLQIAQYLRETLNYNGKQITLEKEFSFLEHYAAIQKLRFGERISFCFECDNDCKNAIVPAIILQPLVENSLIHGIGSYLHDGKICVKAQRHDGENILITVWDNGDGIPPEKVREITENLRTPFQAGQKGTGLRSVLYRLDYYFKKQIFFHMESKQTATQISVIIPYRTE
ncbi:MAG: histidine kinase [Eubacteriales bacterium]|nr:histidine kinase [Eubacteriales bacterium]